MTRRAHRLFLIAGVVIFALVVAQAGPVRLLAEVRAAGWVIVPVVLLYALVYGASTEAWRLTMHERPPRIGFPRAFAITAWAFAVNYVTPLLSLGGEPLKAITAAQWLGRRGATASVVSERLLHIQGHVLFLLTGVALAAVLLPSRIASATALTVVGAALLAIAALLVLAHRRGGAERTLELLQRLPLVRRRAGALEARRAAAVEIDAQIVHFYHESPRRYWMALALEYGGRCIAVLEILLVARALGAPVDYLTAFLILSFGSLAVNLFFFVPFALGAREGGLYVIFALLGLPPALGVAVSVLGRVRELVWIGIGLALGAAMRRRSPAHAPPVVR